MTRMRVDPKPRMPKSIHDAGNITHKSASLVNSNSNRTLFSHHNVLKLIRLWDHAQMKSNQINTYQIILVLEERGKPEYPEKNLSVQSREPTNSTLI